jgi:hypothetical protein
MKFDRSTATTLAMLALLLGIAVAGLLLFAAAAAENGPMSRRGRHPACDLQRQACAAAAAGWRAGRAVHRFHARYRS